MPGPLYFGCYQKPGHRLWAPGMQPVDEPDVPWPDLDGELAPPRARTGEAAVHHKDGWTALAFWDRSIDQQRGNSVFLVPESDLGFDDVISRALKAFPEVFDQLTCVVHHGRGRRQRRSTYHPPPDWWLEDAFVACGPDGEQITRPTKDEAVEAAWDAHERKRQLPLPLEPDDDVR